MAGRHRAPVDHTVARTVTATATGVTLLAIPGSALAATAPTDEALDLISECETGGRNVMNFINDSTHTASGFWQITNSTWRANGGTEFAPTALQASADQQRIVAKRVALHGQPNLGDWNESRHCWGSRMPAAMRGENVTDVHPGGRSAPAPSPVPAPKPAPAPAPPPPPAPTGNSTALTYTARDGDTLSRIAMANHTTVEELARINGISNPDQILAGQVIRLTGDAPASGTYTVQPDDVLWKIAEKTGTTTDDLVNINHLPRGDFITPGQVLKLGGQGISTPDAAYTLAHGDQWTPEAQRSVAEVATRFQIKTVATRDGHRPTADRAADLMTFDNVDKQKDMAQWLIRPENRERLGLEYVISRQRIAGPWTNWSWQPMDDRGSPTANHMDHNHLAFRKDFSYREAGADAVTPAPALAPVHQHQAHIVASGETLDKIAAEEHVSGGWQTLYDANAAAIGTNPNMITPGQSFVLVDTEGTHSLHGALPAVP